MVSRSKIECCVSMKMNSWPEALAMRAMSGDRPRRTVSPRETPPALSVSLTGLVSLAVSGWAICLVSFEMVCGGVAKNAAHGHGPAGAAAKAVAALRARSAPRSAPRQARGHSFRSRARAAVTTACRLGTVALRGLAGNCRSACERGAAPEWQRDCRLAAGSAQAQTLVGQVNLRYRPSPEGPEREKLTMAIHRSLLFAPGNHARRVAKALALDADAVILDLEDACPMAEKAATRPLVVAACQRSRKRRGYVRVNATCTEFGYGDIVAVVAQGVDGIVLPKVESAEEIRAVDWVISNLERERGLAAGQFDVIPIVETGKGMANIRAIAAAAPRIRRIAFGAGDLTLDMNIEWSRGEVELLPYRSECVLASRAAGIEAPLDTVWVDLSDAEGLRASTRHAKSLGYQGKTRIQPEQHPEVHASISPSAT